MSDIDEKESTGSLRFVATSAPTMSISNAFSGPTYLTITGLVSIRLSDGHIEYLTGYTPDAAAKAFWDAMGHYIPRHPVTT